MILTAKAREKRTKQQPVRHFATPPRQRVVGSSGTVTDLFKTDFL
jgi:hypothetical protein